MATAGAAGEDAPAAGAAPDAAADALAVGAALGDADGAGVAPPVADWLAAGALAEESDSPAPDEQPTTESDNAATAAATLPIRMA